MGQGVQGAITEVEQLGYPWFGVAGDVEDGIDLKKVAGFKAMVEDPAEKDEVRVKVYLNGCGEPLEIQMSHARYDSFLKSLNTPSSSTEVLKTGE